MYSISDLFGGKRVIAWSHPPTSAPTMGLPFNPFSRNKRKEIVPWYNMVGDSSKELRKAGVVRVLKVTKRSK